MRFSPLMAIVFAVLQPFSSAAEERPKLEPESVGMSSERLARIRPVMQEYVDQGRLPGAITLVARRGKIAHFECVGYRDIANRLPMEPDTILRFYSQTKPVTGVAVMILYEEGKFLLSDPVSKYLPEFRDAQVMSEDGRLVKAEPMTIKHLLTHTAGLTYWTVPGWERRFREVGDRYNEADLAFHETDAQSLKEWTKRLAAQPLIAQPGTLWYYSVAMDVLGRLVEVWSGMSFDHFLHDRIFQPLGMNDTAFYVPDDKLHRFAINYKKGEDGTLVVFDKPEDSKFRQKPRVCFGGSGLVSTAPDFLRFAQMLLNGGELNGTQILGPRTVKYMMRDHLPSSLGANPLSESREGHGEWPDRGLGFGFTGSVVVNATKTDLRFSEGSFSWGGAANTHFWVDPQEEMAVITLSQVMMAPEPLPQRMAPVVYQAIVD